MSTRIFVANGDPYHLMLLEQRKALDAREGSLAAREEQLKADRAALNEDRAKHDIAYQHYLAFLAARQTKPEVHGPRIAECGTEASPELIPAPEQTGPAPIPLPLRMGAKRRLVLEAVAAGNGLTNRDISEKTGVQIDVVRNITAAETKDGIFTRRDDKLYMTAAGLDYLNRANAKFGPAQKDPPATRAEGVFN